MKTLLKSERGTQGFMLLSDARPEQLQQRSQTSKALMSKYTTYNLFKQREKQPLSWNIGFKLCSQSRYSMAMMALKYNLLHPIACTSYTGL